MYVYRFCEEEHDIGTCPDWRGDVNTSAGSLSAQYEPNSTQQEFGPRGPLLVSLGPLEERIDIQLTQRTS